MADSIANILLRLSGDGSDARAELQRTAAGVRDFDKEHAEASLDVETTRARKNIADLRRQLDQVDRSEVSAQVNAHITTALTELKVIENRLNALDRKDVTVDVDVRRGAIETAVGGLHSLEGGLQGLIPQLRGVSGAAGGAESSLGGMGGAAGGAGTGLGEIGATGPIAAAVIAIAAVVAASLAVALFAVAAAAVVAVGALAAIAVALGGALAAAVLFGVGMKAALAQGGPAGQALKSALAGLKNDLQAAVTPGVKAFISGLIPAIHAAGGALRSITPAFTVFGKALGAAFRDNAPAIATLVRSFGGLVAAVAPLAGPLVRGLTALFQILVNIATAAMPFLVALATAVADAFTRWAGNTSNIDAVRSVIAGIIPYLQSFWNLLVSVGKVFVGLGAVAAPFGKGIVDALAKGAQSLTAWISAHPEQIKQFFADVIPLAGAFARYLAALVPPILAIVQGLAPGLTTFLNGLVVVLKAVNAALQFLMPVLQAFPAIVSAIASPIGLLNLALDFLKSKGIDLAGSLSAAWQALLGVASSVWNAIKTAISTAINATKTAVTSAWNATRSAVTATWNALRAAASAVWNAIKVAVSTAAHAAGSAVTAAWNAARSAVTAVWNAIKVAASSVWNAIKSVIGTAVNAARSVATSAFNALRSAASAAFNAVRSAASAAFNAVKTTIGNAIHAAVGIVRGIAGAFFSAGKALIESMAKGIAAGVGAVVGAVKGVIQKARDLLPGSEPKDPTSPLRGLHEAGRAIIGNLAAGVQAAQGQLAASVMPQLSVTGAALGAGAAGGGSQLNMGGVSFHSSAPGFSDPTEVVALLEEQLRARGAGVAPRAGG